jgi:hypothetical protein
MPSRYVLVRRTLSRAMAVGALAAAASTAAAQVAPVAARPLEISGVPALNFDADEGFGYGAILAVTQYGAANLPYRFNIQPTVFLTTAGRRDFTVTLDAPGVLPGGWRASGFVGRQNQLAAPFYGVGNNTAYDPSLEHGSTRYFYRYGHQRDRVSADFQHGFGNGPLRVLAGGALQRDVIDPSPFDSGQTLFQQSLAGGTARPNNRASARLGLIWDSRDREIGTHSGTWASVLGEGVTSSAEAKGYQRITGTYRVYVPIEDRLTFAERVIGQHVGDNAPVYDLASIQTEFQSVDGLGGASSIRGLPKDRYIGKALALSNSELRWHAADFGLANRASSLVLLGFVDTGRVWADDVATRAAEHGLHTGVGGGARLGFGKTFVVGVDVAHSSESTAPVYIGLGYLF